MILIASHFPSKSITAQRRRKCLEKFPKISFSLDMAKFGWHKVKFLIATESGKTGLVGTNLLKREEVIYVG